MEVIRDESFDHGSSSGRQSLTGTTSRRRGEADPAQSSMQSRASSHALLLGEAPWNDSSKTEFIENDPNYAIGAMLADAPEEKPQVWPSWKTMTRTERTNTAFVVLAVAVWAVLYFPPIFHTADPSDVVSASFTFNGFNYSAYANPAPVQAHGPYRNITLNQAFESATLCAVDYVSGHLELLESIARYSAHNTKRWIESHERHGLPAYSRVSSVQPSTTGDNASDVSIQVRIDTAHPSFRNESTLLSTDAAQNIYKAINRDRFTVGFLE